MSLDVEIPYLLATDEQLHNMRINPSPEVEERPIPEELPLPLPEVDQAEEKRRAEELYRTLTARRNCR